MPKPIYMNEQMIDECFADVRATFEKQFSEALARCKSQKTPLARGVFSFQNVSYEWTNDRSRAKVILEPVAFSKICLLMYNTDKEIGWHGLISRDKDEPTVFHVEDIILYPQTVTSVTVQTDDAKYGDWAINLPDEQFTKLRFHGHSHVNMGVTPSGTDLTYYSSLIKQFKNGFYVFMIINKRMEMYCQVYDFDNNAMYETGEVDVAVGSDFNAQLTAAKKVMVTNETYRYPSYGYNGYYDRDDYEPATINGSNWGARNGSWKKDEPKQSVLPAKDEKKESAGSVNNAGDKSEPLDGQNSLNLPPYVEDNEEPWWKTGRSVS